MILGNLFSFVQLIPINIHIKLFLDQSPTVSSVNRTFDYATDGLYSSSSRKRTIIAITSFKPLKIVHACIKISRFWILIVIYCKAYIGDQSSCIYFVSFFFLHKLVVFMFVGDERIAHLIRNWFTQVTKNTRKKNNFSEKFCLLFTTSSND